ncbi:hypothetical protein [Catenuloplanes japonicus]|uniref:hypothetical protein n=1 Tax=Catenuloplanes japonicus TaxID=33876 RepID=UPI0005264670|nr:hypothetical protein [Catenuloplanes japonicus]
MRIPRGTTVVAVLAALIGAFLTASLANRLAWEHAPELPGEQERAAIGRMVLPDTSLTWHDWATDDPGKAGLPFASVGAELTARQFDAYAPGTPETDRVAEFMDGLRGRLHDAGWTVLDDYSVGPTTIATGERTNDSRALIARNDHLVLYFEDYHDAEFAESHLSLTVHRAEPDWFAPVTFAAGLPGAIAGVLLAIWAARRTALYPAARRATVIVFGLAFAVFLPVLAFGTVYLETLTGAYDSSQPLWAGLALGHEFSLFSVPLLVLLAVAVVIPLCCREAVPVEAGS